MSCQVFPDQYDDQLTAKQLRISALFPQINLALQVARSPVSGYRMRAEFRVWHLGGSWDYVMFDPQTKQRLIITDCPMVAEPIRQLMMPLRELLLADAELSRRLFAVDFLTATTGEVLVTLIYHRPLDEAWDQSAGALSLPQNVMLLGRSRGKKRVLVRDYVEEVLPLPNQSSFKIRHVENAFSQPNAMVNQQMLAWVAEGVAQMTELRDALELYGGAGNFTCVLAQYARSVVMTELSRQAVHSAQLAFAEAQIENVQIAAMDSEQVSTLLSQSGDGTALRWQDKDYEFDLVLVDPPRAGLDEVTRALVQRFEHIIYISCNPETLARDLQVWETTHEVKAWAMFDQFPYTHHIEMGVLLQLRSER
jgi:tRNA (uracil-5-)-methyltransferase